MCDLDDRKTIFPVVKSEINCASDGLAETTKTSLPHPPAVDQSVSWISRATSVLPRILHPLELILKTCLTLLRHFPLLSAGCTSLFRVLIGIFECLNLSSSLSARLLTI